MRAAAADPAPRDDDMDEAARKLDKALGHAIRVMRAERQWSQEDLVARSGISKRTIGRIETGQSSMQMPQMLRIATALGVSLGDLLTRAEELGG
ncbi:helix-turn-helix domain-containing protein [Nocardia sp. CA-290969]|uniref:helix-turn-helix domain-containing protein n=1 Tax=Nocardia sp. CA-290969 TaxID=3239986 RepID=UPI003D941AEC